MYIFSSVSHQVVGLAVRARGRPQKVVERVVQCDLDLIPGPGRQNPRFGGEKSSRVAPTRGYRVVIDVLHRGRTTGLGRGKARQVQFLLRYCVLRVMDKRDSQSNCQSCSSAAVTHRTDGRAFNGECEGPSSPVACCVFGAPCAPYAERDFGPGTPEQPALSACAPTSGR